MKCKTGKITYLNQEVANRKLISLKSKGRNELSIYRCRICRYWHLTSQNSDDIGRPLPIPIQVKQKEIKPLMRFGRKILNDEMLAEIYFIKYVPLKDIRYSEYLVNTWLR